MDGVRRVVAGDFEISFGRHGLVFRTLTDGTAVHAFPFLEVPADCEPFTDQDGPGVLTVESAGNLVRLWRPEGQRWRSVELTRPGLPARRGVRRVTEVSAHGGEALVRYADGVSLRFDTRTGARLAGPELAGPELAGPELAGPELSGAQEAVGVPAPAVAE